MRAVQVVDLSGPTSALRLVDLPEPAPGGRADVVIETHAAGVSFPDVLQTRGLHQNRPSLPFVPGSEVAGIVRSAPPGSGLTAGDRVAALCGRGGFAEVVIAPVELTVKLSPALDVAQGAGLMLNYLTASFALAIRARLREGETVLVHGAAGGLGTAALQVANGVGAHTLAVVSSDEKADVARRAGARVVLRSQGPWRDQATDLSRGGVDVVFDPVGGDRFTDSLRALRVGGRLVVVGFAAGSIPELKVNRLLLNNVDVVGVRWSAAEEPPLTRRLGAELARLVEEGAIRPIVGPRFPLERAGDALRAIAERRAAGKVVLEVR